jgi:hypothetical protein
VFFAVVVSGRYAEYLLGGVMGDYLGATICVTEVCLLTALAMIRHAGRYHELVAGLALQASQVQIPVRNYRYYRSIITGTTGQ